MSGFLDPKPLTPGALDAALTGKINDTGSAARGALNATFVPKWKATTAYLAGDKVLSPGGDVVSAIANFTSGASYDASNWNVSAIYALKTDVPPTTLDGGNATSSYTGTFNFDGGSAA